MRLYGVLPPAGLGWRGCAQEPGAGRRQQGTAGCLACGRVRAQPEAQAAAQGLSGRVQRGGRRCLTASRSAVLPAWDRDQKAARSRALPGP